MSDAERLQQIHMALIQRGCSPISQIVGFLLTGDPTYITNYNGARTLAGQINRTDLLTDIVSYYLGEHQIMGNDEMCIRDSCCSVGTVVSASADRSQITTGCLGMI